MDHRENEKSVIAEIKEFFTSAISFMKINKRNVALRQEIYKYLTSHILTDDERASFFGLSEGCRMRENAKIISPEKFTCGKHVWIGEGAVIDASGGLEIGDYTSIGLYVLVWTHSSYISNINFDNSINNDFIQRKSTKIGKGCFISGHSVIYPGVSIGDRTVVLPMSVVDKDISGNCIVSGSPAKKVMDLNDQTIKMLQMIGNNHNKLKNMG